MDLRLPTNLIQQYSHSGFWPKPSKRGLTMTKFFSRFLAPCLFAMLMVGFSAKWANAQDVASITGIVTDQTGAVLPGVEVTLENPQTGVKYTATTNSEGSYTINQVKPGPGYKIEF